jgi:hypothetical protein
MRCLAVIALCCALPGFAAERSSAECDRERREVRISIESDMAMPRPAVFLDGEERALEIRDWSRTGMVAVLPRALADGVYRIVLRHPAPALRVVEVPLVVGVVGPLVVE